MSKKQQVGGGLIQGALPSFGEDVKRVRLARGLHQKHLGTGAGYSEGYVSKVESGTIVPSPRFAEGCDLVFGTGDLFASQLRRITEGESPSWFAPYLDLERAASAIRDFSTIFVIGLLQTEAYARAALRGGRAAVPDREIDAMTVGRLRRREILEGPKPPRVWVVLYEACLRARVGSSRTMAEQLGHVVAEAERHPTLTVQVLPYTAAETTISAPYTLLEVPGGRPVVYVEGPQGGRPYEAAEAFAYSADLFDRLRASALSPQDSIDYINSAKGDHERDARVDQVELQRPTGGPVRRVGAGARVRRRRGPRSGQQGH